MSRRTLAGLVGLGMLLVGCGEAKPSREDLESTIDDLQGELATARQEIEQKDEQLSDIREKVEAARSASSDLGDAAGRFSEDNWRSVVSEVESAQSEVDSSTAALEDAAAEQ